MRITALATEHALRRGRAELRAEGAACLVGLTPPAVDEHGNAIPPPPQPEKPPQAAAKPKARPKPAKKQQQEQQQQVRAWQLWVVWGACSQTYLPSSHILAPRRLELSAQRI